MLKSLSARVLIALLLGLGVGAWLQASGSAQWIAAANVVEAFGALWLNALRMTVVPLIFAILVTGIASVADAASTGRLAVRALIMFTVLIFGAAIYATVAVEGVLTLWPVDRGAATTFVAGVSAPDLASLKPPGLGDWIKSLAPSNAVKAAADDAVLPLVVFAVFFGFAATRLEAKLREPLVTFFRAVGETMIVIVHWVLLAGPVGVFALSLGVGLRAGFGAAGVLAQYVTIVSLVTIGIILVAWLLAVLVARVPLAKFARAMTPVTAVAFSTQSSLASLPAMLESTRGVLGIPARITDLVLPLAVAVFRFTSPVANLAVAYFITHLYGIEPSLPQMITAIVVSFAVSVAAVGLPGQVSFIVSMAPICVALGAPLEILGILIAVEVVPDIFRTIGNVTGDVMAAAVMERQSATKDALPAA
ncbi:MAG: dicarboxylate/amino acid:cation symporter [Hyphomonadaceae bacterium]|nr:MAG: sodium:dicarboxylate symporter [Caulobacteraceae bacterium]MBT9444068.1 dicarboxylate/amino acid:cation symporter [Hyphomonadaceae bacterium]TPW03882.1 MAG: sodium:dicarboxylate symporter [Alphaproteobacteria bacterium]